MFILYLFFILTMNIFTVIMSPMQINNTTTFAQLVDIFMRAHLSKSHVPLANGLRVRSEFPTQNNCFFFTLVKYSL